MFDLQFGTMTTTIPKIIDSHVHLDLIERCHPARIQWLKDNACGVVSWSYCEGIGSVSQLKEGLEAIVQCVRRHSAAGLSCHYLIGIHPRSIPPDLNAEQIAPLLNPYLTDPLCRGIGEIGLETGDAREREVFTAQLELGRSLVSRRIVGVHTPRSDKAAITAMTLSLLAGFRDISSSIVVDHCTIETIGAVLQAGFRAGVTLSPPKTSWYEMKRILACPALKFSEPLDTGDTTPSPGDRMMCNTDSGSVFYENVVQLRRTGDVSSSIRDKLFYRNAARFFSID